MTIVFMGGSRRVCVLDEPVLGRIDRIVERQYPVLVGDADGADRAIQAILHSRGYRRVEVFCTNGHCRNNVGNWPVRAVSATGSRRDFRYYSAKDRQMASEATAGLMVWDGKSLGTLADIGRLALLKKRVVVYLVNLKKEVCLADERDWERFVAAGPAELRARVARTLRSELPALASHAASATLF
jgi:hypothetical protein